MLFDSFINSLTESREQFIVVVSVILRSMTFLKNVNERQSFFFFFFFFFFLFYFFFIKKIQQL